MMEGRRLADRFLILKTIGAGGATEVSLAQDAEMGELVALRVLSDPFADQWEILRDACRDARQLAHPHIARVFDFYRSEDTPFICREYVEGSSIGEFAGRSNAEEFAVFAEVAAALESAHGLGVVHGDLKASKILRDVRGNVRVIDFQIAAALRKVAPPAAAGGHISPQVRMGEAPVAADDIYSLGVLIARTISTAGAPRELSELAADMCAEQRNARPANLGEVREALAAFSNRAAAPPDADFPAVPVLRAPAAVADRREALPARRDSAGSSRNLQYAIAAGVLALAALVVFVVLPHWIESPGTLEPQSESAELDGEETSPTQRETATASKSSVESLLAQLIPMRERLEAAAVERWAATDYATAKEIEGRGDTAFLDGDYAAAHTHYSEALIVVEGLSGRRGSAFAASLEAGAAAIEDGDQQRAIEAFGLALAIEPNDAVALEGARRAEGLGALMAPHERRQDVRSERRSRFSARRIRKGARNRPPVRARARSTRARRDRAGR